MLDEFLSAQGEALVGEPLKRAMLQRDLWAMFDWLAFRTVDYPREREALQQRLAQIILRLALTEPEIRSLPGNYQAAIASRAFPGEYQIEHPEKAFLPADLFDSTGAWICVGRAGGPLAMTHTEEFPFFGRSVFLVFIRVPGERQDTLDFIQAMNSPGRPDVPSGMEVALVRQMLHINPAGQIISTPIIESLQVRHFPTGQSQRFYQFILDRQRLFAGQSGGLRPAEREFPLFRSHGVDWFEFGTIEAASIPEIPQLCTSCHLDGGLGIHGIQSILSYSRARFPIPDGERPILSESAPERDAQLVIDWKVKHLSWQELQAILNLQP